MTEPVRSLADLRVKTKPPASVAILSQWIDHAEKVLGVPAAGGRIKTAVWVPTSSLHVVT